MTIKHSTKIVKFDLDARERILEGVNTLANAVKITMGPRGRNVIIENPAGTPILTKDGVTVARAINLKDQFPDLGVQLIKEAASRTAEVAGDGTTTATVLSQSIFSEGLKMLAAGFPAIDLKRQIDEAVKLIIENIDNESVEVRSKNEIKQIACISANGEKEISELIFNALEAVGQDGVVTVEEAKGYHSSLEVVEGLNLNRGYLSPYFVTDQDRMICEMNKPRVLVYNNRISSLSEIAPVLEKVVGSESGVLIVADDVEGDAMQGLVLNRIKGSLKVCAIKAPGYGENRVEILNDIAIMLGTKVLTGADKDEIKELELSDLGKCKRAIIKRSNTVLVGCMGDEDLIHDRIKALRSELESPAIGEAERHDVSQRISKLSGGVAVLRVGGATEAELRERKDRVDDALHATKAAISDGILPGGGVSLVRSSEKLLNKNNIPGYTVVKNACEEPLKQIVRNAGGTPEVILEKVKSLSNTQGYDAYNDSFGDMFEMGIIDPTKVVKSALENASAAASMLLTVGCAMISDDDSQNLRDIF